jgi:DNA-directed RNA polymerase subunit RPC12/RpoP
MATIEITRPCHGCGKHYTQCACDRKISKVYSKLRCPYCGEEFRISTREEQWIQRCGNCLRAFDAVNEL